VGGDTVVRAACDPLAPPPTTLQGVLGVGQADGGALYVSDLPAGRFTPRVFLGSAQQLVRQHVLGSGEQGGGASASYVLSFEAPGSDGADAASVQLQVQGETALSMALGPAATKDFTGGTPLTLVDPAQVRGAQIVNLPGVIDYVADATDGTSIAIVSPMDDDSPGAERLFYGPPSAMLERTIVKWDQALSGYPSVTFLVGSASYTMSISVVYGPEAGPLGAPGPGTLDTGTAMVPLTLRMPTPASLAGFSFECLADGG